MTPEQLLIKIKALDLLIDETMGDVQLNDELMDTDACWDADKCASLLQDYLEQIANILKERAKK